jgi:two-component system, OmpR family, response regulator
VKRILVVEDEPTILAAVVTRLRAEEFQVETAMDGPSAVAAAMADPPDLVVLDVMLPGFDGLEVCRRIQAAQPIPVLMLTARSDETDMLIGLGIGADDYLTKPFSPRELLARVRAVLRRYKVVQEILPARDEKRRAYRFAGWELNLRTRRLVSPQGQRVDITNGEFSLLQAFCAAPRRILSRDQLLELSRLNRAEVYDRSIDVQILRLRRKIESNPSHPEYIKTERGAGYMFDVPVDVLR